MMSETKKLHSLRMEGVGTSTVDWYSQYTSYPSSKKKVHQLPCAVQCSVFKRVHGTTPGGGTARVPDQVRSQENLMPGRKYGIKGNLKGTGATETASLRFAPLVSTARRFNRAATGQAPVPARAAQSKRPTHAEFLIAELWPWRL